MPKEGALLSVDHSYGRREENRTEEHCTFLLKMKNELA